MVPLSPPRINRTLSEMVPERCLTSSLGTPACAPSSSIRSSAAKWAPIYSAPPATWGEPCGSMSTPAPRSATLTSKFLSVGSALQLFPLRSERRHDQKSGNESSGQDFKARGRRSPLTTWRMSRIAKGSYCRARCSQKQALAQIAKSGGLRFRSELPAMLASGRAAGWAPMLALSYPNEAALCATALT
jgi:hypothetical protein